MPLVARMDTVDQVCRGEQVCAGQQGEPVVAAAEGVARDPFDGVAQLGESGAERIGGRSGIRAADR
ncbi:hypothetical protein [Streptomyces sp. NPDC055134]